MKATAGPFNSTLTRVKPVFEALLRKDEAQWLPRLCRLAVFGHPESVLPASVDCRFIDDPAYGDHERPLAPPKSLLRWLVRNAADWSGTALATSGSAKALRQRLLERHQPTIEEALRLIAVANATSGWYILEGPSYPDVYIETGDTIVVIEGKRTEPTPTTSTKWMPVRHQMLRHLDGAWENRGSKNVLGMFLVDEMTDAYRSGVWRDAAEATFRSDVLEQSLPHRSRLEQQAIAKCFLGMTTWQAIVREFDLSTSVLIERL